MDSNLESITDLKIDSNLESKYLSITSNGSDKQDEDKYVEVNFFLQKKILSMMKIHLKILKLELRLDRESLNRIIDETMDLAAKLKARPTVELLYRPVFKIKKTKLDELAMIMICNCHRFFRNYDQLQIKFFNLTLMVIADLNRMQISADDHDVDDNGKRSN